MTHSYSTYSTSAVILGAFWDEIEVTGSEAFPAGGHPCQKMNSGEAAILTDYVVRYHRRCYVVELEDVKGARSALAGPRQGLNLKVKQARLKAF